MKVMLATHRTNQWLGVNKYFYLLGKYLARLGVEVNIIVDSMGGYDAVREICGDSVDIVTLGPTALGPISTARYCRNVANYLEGHQDFDVLHCGHVVPFFYLAAKKRHPVVFQPFGNELFTLAGDGLNSWYCWMAQFVLRYCGEHADVLLAEGEFQLEEMRQYYPGVRRLEVLPVGVDTEDMVPKDHHRDGAFRFLAVNSLLTYEGMDDLIRAFREACVWTDARLVIVGSGSEGERLRKMAVALPVEFREGLSETELEVQYVRSDAFVCTTHERDMQMGVLEAMASGLPVIARDARWLPDSVIRFNGFTELRDEMIGLMATLPRKRREVAEKGLEEVRQYSFTRIAEKALEIYEGLV